MSRSACAVSARTDNQIVSLIATAAICGAFYLVGSPAITALVGNDAGQWLRDLGAGSRFDSITRGVLDLRDLAYYLSITALFLVLNRLALERLRWAGNPLQAAQRRWLWAAGLLAANAIAVNLWLGQLGGARVDLTQGHQYTLSDATRRYLGELKEPLLIRGYFSAETHPLLAPLVPQLRDLLAEYAVAGGSKVRVEFVDPRDDPRQEEEAASHYGIRPVPFQIASKYQASVVNSYFDDRRVLRRTSTRCSASAISSTSSRAARVDIRRRRCEPRVRDHARDPQGAAELPGRRQPVRDAARPVRFTGYVSGADALPPALRPARPALEPGPRRPAARGRRQAAGGASRTPAPTPRSRAQLGGLGPAPAGGRACSTRSRSGSTCSSADGHEVERVPLPRTLDRAAFKHSLEAGGGALFAGLS